jgi:hypothetical protein
MGTRDQGRMVAAANDFDGPAGDPPAGKEREPGARLREVGEPFRILTSEQRAVIREELHLADHCAASLKPSHGRWIRPI